MRVSKSVLKTPEKLHGKLHASTLDATIRLVIAWQCRRKFDEVFSLDKEK